jgi:hypothetical protein
MDPPGSRRNLCGAAPTLADLRWRDFAAALKDPEWAPKACPECLKILKES